MYCLIQSNLKLILKKINLIFVKFYASTMIFALYKINLELVCINLSIYVLISSLFGQVKIILGDYTI